MRGYRAQFRAVHDRRDGGFVNVYPLRGDDPPMRLDGPVGPSADPDDLLAAHGFRRVQPWASGAHRTAKVERVDDARPTAPPTSTFDRADRLALGLVAPPRWSPPWAPMFAAGWVLTLVLVIAAAAGRGYLVAATAAAGVLVAATARGYATETRPRTATRVLLLAALPLLTASASLLVAIILDVR